MATFKKRLLSGCVDGKAIKIAAIATAGTLIHTAVAGQVAGTYDEIWLWAYNYNESMVILTLEWGGVSVVRMTYVRPPIVCFCGSTRVAEKFNEEAIRFTLDGWIVLRPEVVQYSSDGDPQHSDPITKLRLDVLHFAKIDLADLVYVINVGGYIGSSTRDEIAYAKDHGKPLRYLEPTQPAQTR